MRFQVISTLSVLVGLQLLDLGVGPAKAAGHEFKDCQDCPVMVVVPAGTGFVGSTVDEARLENMPMMGPNDISAWERPKHEVTIPAAFAMGKYEVTRSQFAYFIANSGYRPLPNCSSSADGEENSAQAYSWDNPGFAQGDNHPVVCVSWTDAQAYADWLSQHTGQAYRLPSEAEWEYAARAGSETARFWGDGLAEACMYSNSADETHLKAYAGRTFLDTHVAAGGKPPAGLAQAVPCNDEFVETAPVGTFQPNAFDLHDMLGNVWEWVEDCFHSSYQNAPVDGTTWADRESCDRAPEYSSELVRVFRGGAFSYPPYGLRSARRGKGGVDRRLWNMGFRLVREMD